MMQKLFYTVLLFICCSAAATAQAGKPSSSQKPAQKPAAKEKPLSFRTTWGIFLSDTLPRPEVVKLLDSSLVVRDNKNNKFPVVSFDFTYETKEAYLNDTTQQVGFYTDAIGDSFKSDRLSTLWSTRLKETVQKGEVLLFSNIVVRYTGDKYYRVPEVRIVVN
ncbi:hypothetical protein ACFOTA_04390 [Chitinophaga sp. GCM10012297]|uniref:Gliding motility-associated lipoprotein GldH n=1 Tax=Chitinophaga chungangae TaxID=2821488 RepID=A0ABS3YAS0_9BACT|nr:hypothetical protein [Chitinophaga chungangae]MBO9151433.1 hypothetical protein [Chitinophaga chungangae]